MLLQQVLRKKDLTPLCPFTESHNIFKKFSRSYGKDVTPLCPIIHRILLLTYVHIYWRSLRKNHGMLHFKCADSESCSSRKWTKVSLQNGAAEENVQLKIRQSTIQYTGSLGWWEKRLIDQASDVLSIILRVLSAPSLLET